MDDVTFNGICPYMVTNDGRGFWVRYGMIQLVGILHQLIGLLEETSKELVIDIHQVIIEKKLN